MAAEQTKNNLYIVDPADMPGGDRVVPEEGLYSVSIIAADDPYGFEVCRVLRRTLKDARKAAANLAEALSVAGVKLK